SSACPRRRRPSRKTPSYSTQRRCEPSHADRSTSPNFATPATLGRNLRRRAAMRLRSGGRPTLPRCTNISTPASATCLPPLLPRQIQRYRIPRRAGRALHFERRPHEKELVDLVGNQLRQVHVLEVPDAPLGLHLDVAFERLWCLAARALAHRLHRPRVG